MFFSLKVYVVKKLKTGTSHLKVLNISFWLAVVGVITSFIVDPCHSWLTVGTSSGMMVCWDLRFQLPITNLSHPRGIPTWFLVTIPLCSLIFRLLRCWSVVSDTMLEDRDKRGLEPNYNFGHIRNIVPAKTDLGFRSLLMGIEALLFAKLVGCHKVNCNGKDFTNNLLRDSLLPSSKSWSANLNYRKSSYY